MSGLKYLLIVLLVETARSVPVSSKHVRSANLQIQPSSSYRYPIPLPYQQQQFPYQQQPFPYQQQQFPFQQPILFNQQPILPIRPEIPLPNESIGKAQTYPVNQQNYPFYPSSYPSYGSVYPSFPNYQPYPFYPSYPSGPFQPSYPNYPDPFAGIPTEIIDVDDNGNFDPELSWDDILAKAEVSSSHHTSALEPQFPFSSTQIVESKPVQTTITRTFESGSSDPVVDIKYSDPASNSGSGTLIEAGENEVETKGEDNNKAKDENDVNEEVKEEKTEEDTEVKKGGFFSWG